MWKQALGAAAAIAALTLVTGAQAAETKPAADHCFTSGSWRGWTAAKGGDALYLRVNVNDIYQVDLSPGTHARRSGGDFLVNKVRGSNWICSAVDLDLSISDDQGFRRPLIATNMRKLTPIEVAAIPKKELP